MARRSAPDDEPLLDLGADIEARDADGLTPLLGASLERDGSVVVRQLLARGADVNARTAQGDSARDRAAEQIAALEQQEAMAQQDGVATAEAIAASAQRRLSPRSMRAMVAHRPCPLRHSREQRCTAQIRRKRRPCGMHIGRASGRLGTLRSGYAAGLDRF